MTDIIGSQKPLVIFSNKLNTLIEDVIKSTKIANKEKNTTKKSESDTISAENPTDESAQKVEELKKFAETEGKVAILADYDLDLRLFMEIVQPFNEIPPNPLVFIISKKIDYDLSELANFITIVRTASTITKDGKLIDFVVENCQKLIENLKKLQYFIFSEQENSIPIYDQYLLKKPEIIGSDFGSKIYMPTLFQGNLCSKLDKWYYLTYHKDAKFIIEKKRQNSPLEKIFLPLLSEIKKEIKQKKKEDQYITLKEIIRLHEFDELKYRFFNLYLSKEMVTTEKTETTEKKPGKKVNQKTDRKEDNVVSMQTNKQVEIKADDLIPGIIYLINQKGFISEQKKAFIDVLSKKRISAELRDFISETYREFLRNLLKPGKENEKLFSEKADKIFAKSIINEEKDLEKEILDQKVKESEKKNLYKEKILSIFEILNKCSDWFLGFQQYLSPFGDVIRKNLKTISLVRDDLTRKNDEFLIYLDSIIEQNVRVILDSKIDEKIGLLEGYLKSYEDETSEIILKDIPQAQKLEDILDDFETKFQDINKEVTQIFIQYKDNQHINIYSNIKRWEDKFEEIKNRVKFVVSALFSSFFDKFKGVIKKEQGFFSTITETKVEDPGLPFIFSADLLLPERLTEKQMRERLHEIDQKIKEIETLKESYQKERDKYEDLIRKFLKEKGDITSQQCVICHKPIDVVNDHFIKCEFCGRLSHYMCSAWWLDKHNSCPVCNNQYLIPNSGLYDSDYYNPDEDGTDYGNGQIYDEDEDEDENEYLEPDLEKYPPQPDKKPTVIDEVTEKLRDLQDKHKIKKD